MEIILLILFIIFIIIIFNSSEYFESSECSKISEGECNSKLCPEKCKIKLNKINDKCHCVNRSK